MAVALAACNKQGVGDTTSLPAETRLQAAQGPSGLAVPALFASIPADTPYLLASLEPAPPGVWPKLEQLFKPLLEGALARSEAKHGKNKGMDAILSELAGKWNEAGLESLGFSAQPRFAVYGLGLQPAVVRMAIKDGKTVRATIERLAAKAGDPLRPAITRGGRSYWLETGSDGTSVVLSIGDRELVAAVGKPRDVEAKLDLILGLQKPARSMADGALVKQLMASHGFGGQLIGFADTRQLAARAIEAAGATPGPACTGEIDRLSAKLPRLVVGYSELSASRIAGSFVVEMAPDLVAAMRALKTEVPGLGAAMSGHPIMAFAAGLDLVGAQQLGNAAVASLRQLGAACGLGSLVNGTVQVARRLSQPLPELATQISGGAVVIDDIEVRAGDHSATPERIDGVLLLASPDARALFDKAVAMEPLVKSLGIEVDGKLHDLHMPVPIFRVPAVGVSDRVIVVTAGDRQRGAGDRLIAAPAGDTAPLLAASYDFRKLMDFTERTGGLDRDGTEPEVRAVLASMKDLFGNFSGTLDVTDRGLVMWSSIELK
ncbi:MAG TPA: hypothetical protein VHT91_38090 [Kofleriaceae bacterium]|nr:hypothetical protein [Kofleriaceae bacterium]